MEKKFQIIRDFVQYDLVLSPIEDELKKRGWVIIYGRGSNYNVDKGVKGSLGCQTGAWVHKNPPIKPSFLIFHGVSFIKNWAQQYPNWDYVIVPSKFFEDNLSGNILGLGWSKADYYINNKNNQSKFRDFVKKQHKITDDKPLILFAPTYSTTKGSQPPGNADKLMEIVKQLPHCNVIFMPHQMCEYKNKFDAYKLKVDADFDRKFDYLLGCDLLIGDISSLVFEFALLDKPIVLIDNPKFPGYLKIAKAHMNHEGLDLGEIVSRDKLPDLRKAVDDSLADPLKYKDRRDYWVEKALGYCDGNSTQKIVDKIEEICG